MKTHSSPAKRQKSPATPFLIILCALLAIALLTVSIILARTAAVRDALYEQNDASLQKNLRFFALNFPNATENDAGHYSPEKLEERRENCYTHAYAMTELYPTTSYAENDYQNLKKVIDHCFEIASKESIPTQYPVTFTQELNQLAALLFEKDLAEAKAELILETYFAQ